jgi:hypothetical protein
VHSIRFEARYVCYTLLLHCCYCCYTVVTRVCSLLGYTGTLLLHCCHALHCCYITICAVVYTVVTLLLHCCYAVVYTVVTLLLRCCYAALTCCCYSVCCCLLHALRTVTLLLHFRSYTVGLRCLNAYWFTVDTLLIRCCFAQRRTVCCARYTVVVYGCLLLFAARYAVVALFFRSLLHYCYAAVER